MNIPKLLNPVKSPFLYIIVGVIAIPTIVYFGVIKPQLEKSKASDDSGQGAENGYFSKLTLQYRPGEIIISLDSAAEIDTRGDKVTIVGGAKNSELAGINTMLSKYTESTVLRKGANTKDNSNSILLKSNEEGNQDCFSYFQMIRLFGATALVPNLRPKDCNNEEALDRELNQDITILASYKSVKHVQPNYIYEVNAAEVDEQASDYTPSDQYYQYQWALNNTGQQYPLDSFNWSSGTPDADMDLQEGWDLVGPSGGNYGEGVIVAVIDTGVDYSHPDLQRNVWINQGELNGKDFTWFTGHGGIDVNSNGSLECIDLLDKRNVTNPSLSGLYDLTDNDGNGYVDDICGWDFVNYETCEDDIDEDGNCEIDPGMDKYPRDVDANFWGHGTGISGIIAAERNSIGVVGISFNSKIMALRAADRYGQLTTTNAAAAISYAVDNGAKVINMSFGNYSNDTYLREAVDYAYEHDVFMAAGAGNFYGIQGVMYPAKYKEVVGVTASDANDNLANYADYGSGVDVSGLGHNVLSTMSTQSYCHYHYSYNCMEFDRPTKEYAIVSGTSDATPHVAGLAALIRAKNPSWNSEQVRQAIINGVDDRGDGGFDDHWGFGRINAQTSLSYASIPYVNINSPFLSYDEYKSEYARVQGTVEVSGRSSGADIQNWTMAASLVGTNDWLGISAGTSLGTDFSMNWDSTTQSDGIYYLRIQATNADGNMAQDIVKVYVDNTYISSPIKGDLYGKGSIAFIGAVNSTNFDTYTFRYKKPDGSYSTDGITLPDPIVPVQNGIIATVDTSGFSTTENGNYIFELTVSYSDNRQEILEHNLIIDTMIASNYPLRLGQGFNSSSYPVSLTSDSSTLFFPSIFDWSEGSKVNINGFESGAEIGRVPIASGLFINSYNYYLPLVDTNNDNQKEVIFAESRIDYSHWWELPSPRITHFDQNGNEVGQVDFSNIDINFPNGGHNVIASDLDNNSIIDYVIVVNDKLYRVENGEVMTGFPLTVSNLGFRSQRWGGGIAVADINGDNVKEIVYADTSWNHASLLVISIGDADHNGQADILWRYDVQEPIYSQPLVADLNRDNNKEIIFGTASGVLYVLNKDGGLFDADGDGTPEWPQVDGNGDQANSFSPVVSNMDGDSDLEIGYMRTFFYPIRLSVSIYNPDGTQLNDNWPITVPNSFSPNYWSWVSDSMLLTDVNRDGTPEVVFPSNLALNIFTTDGVQLNGWPRIFSEYPISQQVYRPDMALSETVKDGHKYIILSLYKDSSIPGGGLSMDKIVAYDLGEVSINGEHAEWNYFAANIERTGEYINPEVRTADLSVNVQVTPDPVLLNSPYSYNISVSNRGPDVAINTVLIHRLPEQVEYQSASSSQGTCSLDGLVVNCQLGAIEASGSATVTLQVVPRQEGSLNSDTNVSSDSTDPRPMGNSIGTVVIIETIILVQNIGLFSPAAKILEFSTVPCCGVLTTQYSANGVTFTSNNANGWATYQGSGFTNSKPLVSSGTTPPVGAPAGISGTEVTFTNPVSKMGFYVQSGTPYSATASRAAKPIRIIAYDEAGNVLLQQDTTTCPSGASSCKPEFIGVASGAANIKKVQYIELKQKGVTATVYSLDNLYTE